VILLALLAVGVATVRTTPAHAVGPSQLSRLLDNLGGSGSASKACDAAQAARTSSKLNSGSSAGDSYLSRGDADNPAGATDGGRYQFKPDTGLRASRRLVGKVASDEPQASARTLDKGGSEGFAPMVLVGIAIVGLLYLSGVLKFGKGVRHSREPQP